ncbi:MAG TPA: YbhB/YbcL family Raf kinase inhibitor-like protein, partial [Gemmatimonadaceae bacterium]
MKASALCVLCLLTLACQRETPSVADSSTARASAGAATDTASRSNAMTLKVTSSAFQQGGSIPAKYTCEGQDVSPPLAWAGVPASAKSIAMIVDDPDAPDPAKPQRVYVHWVLYNIPGGISSLSENASKSGLP